MENTGCLLVEKSYHTILYNIGMPKGYNKDGTPRIPPNQKGVMRSEETKAKLSLVWKGKKRPPFSEEWKRRISMTCKLRGIKPNSSPEVHKQAGLTRRNDGKPRKSKEKQIWKGRSEWKEWREAVFKRDNWICQQCGKTKCILEPHHLQSWAKYPKLRFEISNGQTLCQECHRKTNNYGYKATNI